MSYNNNIGVLDPEGLNINPLTGFDYQDIYLNNTNNEDFPPPKDETGRVIPKTYVNYAKWWTKLPVYENKMGVLQTIEKNRVTLIKSGTGSGKTVLIPIFALHAFDYKKKVAVCIPKVLSVVKASKFGAVRLDVELGSLVGYSAGGVKNFTDETKLLYSTTGFLVEKITVGGDPYLKDFECVIIDEVHERQSETDFLMYLLRKVLEVRPEFKLIIMSATIDFTIFQNYFKDFVYGEFDVGGKSPYDIEQFFEKKPLKQDEWKIKAVEKIVNILTTTDKGDILVFTPNADRKKQLCSKLEQKMEEYVKKNPESKIVPYCTILASGIDKDLEDLATDEKKYKDEIKPAGYNKGKNYTRKVVISTNVAESSLTVDGLKYVIDSGLENEAGYDYKTNCEFLITKYASQSSIIQRKGRGGRTGPGVCYHLYTEEEFKNFEEFSNPNIFKENYWKTLERGLNLPYIKNVGDIIEFSQSFIESPKKIVVTTLIRKLYHLGYFTSPEDDGVLTWLGKALLDLKLDPSFTKALIASYFYGVQQYVVPLLVLQNNLGNSFDILDYSKVSQDNVLKTQFMNFFNELKNNYGDALSIYHIYDLYSKLKKDLKENQNFNDFEIKDQMNIVSERHFINFGKLEKIKDESFVIKEKFLKVMDSYVDEDYNITMRDVLKPLFDIDYMNKLDNPIYKVLLSLFEGYFVFSCKKKEGNNFKLIYPARKNENKNKEKNKTPGPKVSIPEMMFKSQIKLVGKENTFLRNKNDILFGMKFFSKLNYIIPNPMEVGVVIPNNIPDSCMEYVKEKYKDIINFD